MSDLFPGGNSNLCTQRKQPHFMLMCIYCIHCCACGHMFEADLPYTWLHSVFGCSNSHLTEPWVGEARVDRITLSTCISHPPDVMMESHSCMTQIPVLLLRHQHPDLFFFNPRLFLSVDYSSAHVPLLQGLNPSGFYSVAPVLQRLFKQTIRASLLSD